MKHVLRLVTIGQNLDVPLTPSEFATLSRSRRILSHAFRLEETYGYVVANYLDFERALLDISLTSAVQNMQSYTEIQMAWSALSLKLVNLLTTTRLYLDQGPQLARDCLPDKSDTTDVVKAFCSEQYDRKFEYRFMEALRNHVQHCGAAIHFFRPSQQIVGEEAGHLEYQYDVLAKRANLAENPDFKKKVLNEMLEEVSLKAAAREYVESISVIHEKIRDLISGAVNVSRQEIEAAHLRYKELSPSASSTAIAAMAVDDDMVQDSVPLLLDWDDVRIQLQRRNPRLANLALRHINTRTSDRPKTHNSNFLGHDT